MSGRVHAVAQGIAVVRALEAVYPPQQVEDSKDSGAHNKNKKKKIKKKKNKPKKAPLLKRAASAGWSAVLGVTDVLTGASRRRRRRNITALATISAVDVAATINDCTDVLRATEAAARCAMAAEENRTRRMEAQLRCRRAREAVLEDSRRRYGAGGLMERARRIVLLHATAAAIEPQLSLVLDGIDFFTGERELIEGVEVACSTAADTVPVSQKGRRWYKPDDHNALAKRAQLLLLRNQPVDAERMFCKAIEHGHARHGGGAALLRQLATARFGVWRQFCTPEALASAYDTFVRAAQYPANQASSEFDCQSSRGLRDHVPALLNQIAKLHVGHGSFSGALSLLDKLLSDFPSFEHRDVEHQYARILFHLGYYEGAVALWRAQLRSAADNANVVDGAVYAGSYAGDDDDVGPGEEPCANVGGSSTVVAPLPYQAPDLRFQIARALELLDRAGEGTLRPVRFDAAAVDDMEGNRRHSVMGEGVLPPLLSDEVSRKRVHTDKQTEGNKQDTLLEDFGTPQLEALSRTVDNDVASDSSNNPLILLSNGDMTASRKTGTRPNPDADNRHATHGKSNPGRIGHFGRTLTGSAVTVPCHRAHAMTVGRHVVEMVISACHGQHLGIGVCFVGHDLTVPLGSCSDTERDIRSKVNASAADDGETEGANSEAGPNLNDTQDNLDKHEGQDLSGAHDLEAEREAVTRVAEGARSWCFRSGGAVRFGGLERPYGQAFAAGDRILMEVDVDDGTLTYYKNGECLGVAFRDMRRAWRGRALVPAISLKEDGDKVMLVGTVKLPVKVGPMAPNNLAYRAYERYFEEEIISRPRRVGEGGDGYENGSRVGAPSDAVAMAKNAELSLSTENVIEADGVQLAAWGDKQVVGTGTAALASLGAIPVMWPPPRPSDGYGRRDRHKYKFDWRHDYMCWRARGLRYRYLQHWELALDAFSEAVELAHTLGVYVEPGVFDPLSDTLVSKHNNGLCIGALPELLLLQCDAQRHFSEHAAALVSAKRALSFDRFNRTLRRLLSSLYPEAFGPIFRRQNLAATAIAAFYRGCVGRHFARKRIAGAIFSQRTIHAAFARRERGRHGAAALVGEMWNTSFATRAFAASWLRATYWDERDRLLIFSAVLSIQHAWRTYAMYLKRFNASIKVQKSWRSHRVRHALLAATQRAQQYRVNVDGPRRIQEALAARDCADGWGDRDPVAATASDTRLTAAAITQRRHDAAAAAARSGRLAAHRRRSKELTMEERKRGHWPKSFVTQDASARDVARAKHARNPNMTSKALEARIANKSKTMGALDEKRLLALGVEDALVGVPVLTRDALTVELPKHLTGGGADGGEGKVASLLRKLRERGRYRTVYEWIPAKLFLRRFAPELIELPLVEAARRLKLEGNEWCRLNDAEEQVGFKWRRKGTRRELDFDFDFLDKIGDDEAEEVSGDDALVMTSAVSFTTDGDDESQSQNTAAYQENMQKTQGSQQRKVKLPSKNILSRIVRNVPDSGAEPIPFSPSHLCDRTRTFQQDESELDRTTVQAELDRDLNDDEVRLHVSFADKAKHRPMSTEPGIFDDDINDQDGDSTVDTNAMTHNDTRRRAADPIGATSYTIEGRKPLEVSSGYGVAVHGVNGIYRSQGYQTSVPGLNDPVFRAHRFYVVQVHEEDRDKSLDSGANASATDVKNAHKRRAARHGHLRFELRRRTPVDGGGATLAQWRPQVADRSLAPQNRAQYLSGGTGKQPFEELAHEHAKRHRAGGAGAGGTKASSQRTVDTTSASAKVRQQAKLEAAPTTRVVRGGKSLAAAARFKPGSNSLLGAQPRDAHIVGVAPSRFAANPVATSNSKSGATGSGSKRGAVSLAVAKGRDAQGIKLAPLREGRHASSRAAEKEEGDSTAPFSFAAQRKRLAARASQQRIQDEEIYREQRERDIELDHVLGSTPTRAPRRRDDFGALSSVDYRVEMLPNGALGRGTVQTEFQVTSPLGKGTALYRVPGWSGLRDPLLAASNAGSEAEDKLPPIGGSVLGVSNPATGNLCQASARDVPVSIDGRELQQLTLSRTALAKQRNRNMEASHGLVSEAAPTPQFVKVSGGMDREELSSSATRISAEWHKNVF